jgi:hypothetical protein
MTRREIEDAERRAEIEYKARQGGVGDRVGPKWSGRAAGQGAHTSPSLP